MLIDDYIRHWATLISESCDEGIDSVLEGKKRNHQTLSDEQISLNIKRSMTNLMKTTRVNHFLFVFSDGHDKSIDFRRKGHQYKLKFTKGNRDFGAQKIARVHLIDGGCAYSGCFSLSELNRDLQQILTSGSLNFKGTTMELSWKNPDGLEWWIIAFKKGNEWIVNSIHTTRNQSATRKMQHQAPSQPSKK